MGCVDCFWREEGVHVGFCGGEDVGRGGEVGKVKDRLGIEALVYSDRKEWSEIRWEIGSDVHMY